MQSINLATVSDDDYVKKNLKQILPVDLEPLQIAAVAEERAKQEKALAELRTEWSDLKKEKLDEITAQERKVEKLGEDIARKKQDKVVLCDEIFHRGSILTVRQDTGLVVGNRPASPQEAQRHLPAVEGGNGVLAQAAAAQKANNSQEDDEGDVIADDGSDEKPSKRGKKK